MSLFVSTGFHADVVVILARGLRVGLYARLSEITAVLCAAVRPCRSCGAQRAHPVKHREQNEDSIHEDFSSHFLPVVFWLVTLAVLSSAARMPLASLRASSFAQKCMKNRRGCSSSMWLCRAVTSIPFVRNARMTGLTS